MRKAVNGKFRIPWYEYGHSGVSRGNARRRAASLTAPGRCVVWKWLGLRQLHWPVLYSGVRRMCTTLLNSDDQRGRNRCELAQDVERGTCICMPDLGPSPFFELRLHSCATCGPSAGAPATTDARYHRAKRMAHSPWAIPSISAQSLKISGRPPEAIATLTGRSS